MDDRGQRRRIEQLERRLGAVERQASKMPIRVGGSVAGEAGTNIVIVSSGSSDIDAEDQWYKMELLSPVYPQTQSWLTVNTEDDYIQMSADLYFYTYQAILKVNLSGTSEGIIEYYLGSNSSNNAPIKGDPIIRTLVDAGAASSITIPIYSKGFFSSSSDDENTFWHRIEGIGVDFAATPATARQGTITLFKSVT